MGTILAAYSAASFDHMLSAFFLGLLPVVVVTAVVSIIICLATRSRDHLLFTLAFSVLGASLGLMLGASREPVVQAFLPAIITLVSGLLLVVFPTSAAAQALNSLTGTPLDTATVQRFVMIGVSAMLIASVTSAFWGGSVRGIREQDDRRYTEWHEKYVTVQLPLELELLRLNYGIPTPAVTAPASNTTPAGQP